MNHWSLNAWNDWRWLRPAAVEVSIIRLTIDASRGHAYGFDIALLGFGLALHYWPTGKYAPPVESLGREHGDGTP